MCVCVCVCVSISIKAELSPAGALSYMKDVVLL